MNFAAWLRASAMALAIPLVSMGAEAEGGDKTSPVSLYNILAYADEHAPGVLVARAQTERGQAAVDGARVVLQKNTIAGAMAGPRFAQGARGTDYQLWLRQPIEIAGERKQRRNTAEKTRERTHKELEEVRWQVHREVHAAFHLALVARERWSLAEKILVSTEELLSVAERRHQAGDISELAVRLAKGELAQARQASLAAEQEYRSAQLRLAEVSGWPADVLPEPVGELDEPKRAPPMEELAALALAKHPGIGARVGAIAEAEARVRLEDREAWPEPSLGVTYTRESLPIVGLNEHIVQGLMTLPIPFTQRNQEGRARARAELSVAKAEKQAFVQALKVRLARAANAVNADAARIAAYGTEILPAFEGNLTLLRRAFELGEADLLQVLVGRERLLRIQQDALTAYQDYYRDAAALEAEVGIEVWPDEHHQDEGDLGEQHDH
ncbi:MAG: TolC family protein [Myxococcales bacterium]|nr:TolC family protein [Myxococcales bacterium]